MSDRRTVKIHSGVDAWEQVKRSARASRQGKRSTAPVVKRKTLDIDKLDFNEQDINSIPEDEKWERAFEASELTILKQHQRDGISFMWYNLVRKKVGCILAHAMGLGKTCQILYLIRALQLTNKGKRFVVIATPSLVNTWETEAKKWFPQIDIYKVTSVQNPTDRYDQIYEWYNNEKGSILITTYSRLSAYVTEVQNGISTKEITSVKKMMFAHADVVCIDEAQQIKNDKSAKTMACRAFDTQLRVACSGTPMMNNIDELTSIIDFVRPDTWSKKGASEYIKPIHDSMRTSATKFDINLAEHRAKAVVNRLAGVVHRRDQTILKADLPEIHQYILRLKLSDIQAKLYQRYTKDFLSRKGDKCLFEYRAMTNRIAMHPLLIYSFINRRVEESNADPNHYKWATEILSNDDWSWLNQDDGNVSVKQLLGCSSKLQALLGIIETCWERGEKVLIFSSYVEILKFVKAFLLQCGECGTIGFFDGETPPKERNRIVGDFQKGLLNVLLLSYGVGGVGLTLTKATKVILLETNWNWAEIQQAIFRAYRYGQTKPVTSYQLISDGTMEDKVLTMMMRKDWLHRRIIDDETPTRQHIAGDMTYSYYGYTPRKRITWHQCPLSNKQEIDPMIESLEKLDDILTQASEYSTLLANDPDAGMELDDEQVEKSKHHLEEFHREVSNGAGLSGLINHSAMILQKKLQLEKKNREKRKLSVRFSEDTVIEKVDETTERPIDRIPKVPPGRKIQKVDPRVTYYTSQDLSKAREIVTRHAANPEVDAILADVGGRLHDTKRWCLTGLLAREVPSDTDTHGIIDLIFMQVLTNGASLMQNFLQVHPPSRRALEEMKCTLPQYSEWENEAVRENRDVANWVRALKGNRMLDATLDVSQIFRNILHQRGLTGADSVRDAFLQDVMGAWLLLPKWLATLIGFALNMNVSPVQYLIQMGFRSIMDWQIANNNKIKAILRNIVLSITGIDPDTSNLVNLASQVLAILFAPAGEDSEAAASSSSSLEEDSIDMLPIESNVVKPLDAINVTVTDLTGDSDDDIITPFTETTRPTEI